MSHTPARISLWTHFCRTGLCAKPNFSFFFSVARKKMKKIGRNVAKTKNKKQKTKQNKKKTKTKAKKQKTKTKNKKQKKKKKKIRCAKNTIKKKSCQVKS